MATRTTIKTLRYLVATLNTVTGHETEAYRQTPAGCRANIGTYVLDCAYGGYRLAQLVSETGGERNITPRYSAATTADLIRAYMDGLREGKEPRYPQHPIAMDPAA